MQLLPEAIVAETERMVRQRMRGQSAGHGMDHVLRVLHNARQLQSEVGGDRLTIELAALLHDVGDAKFHDGRERSGEFARDILFELHVPEALIQHVAEIVDNISFRKQVDANTLSLEGRIVQDADRLDALGAIGIVRTIEFGAKFDQPFWSGDDNAARTGVGHFYEKLFKLTQLMNTAPARRIAQQREMFMRSFLDQFFQECELKEQGSMEQESKEQGDE